MAPYNGSREALKRNDPARHKDAILSLCDPNLPDRLEIGLEINLDGKRKGVRK
jgi:hypothetical protein